MPQVGIEVNKNEESFRASRGRLAREYDNARTSIGKEADFQGDS
jgi:hypothetical protein